MKADTASMSQRAEPVEVLVIGGGVIGSSIAYHVARQGRTVLVVERHEVAVEPAASWASGGGVTPDWGQHPAEAALARAALARWPTLAEELEAELHYRKCGHLLLAENDGQAAHLQALAQRNGREPSTGPTPSVSPCKELPTASWERRPGVASCKRSRPCSRPGPGAGNWP